MFVIELNTFRITTGWLKGSFWALYFPSKPFLISSKPALNKTRQRMSKEGGANWGDCQSGIPRNVSVFCQSLLRSPSSFDVVVGMIANVQFPVLLAPLNEEDNCQDGATRNGEKRSGRTEVKRAGLNSSVYPDTAAAAAADHDKRSDKERRKGTP